ncbi:MAG: homoserine O-succinyltransferase [Gemmatimonadetes bacterium]|nr:homoserine O-succinyltransferase [Gemmatimonadota bacterium]
MPTCSAARAVPASAANSTTRLRPSPGSPLRTRVRARIAFDHLPERSVPVHYEAHGDPSAPATAVLGGISAGRHLAPTPSDARPGWWRGLVGAGAALDPASRLLIGIDFLGGTSEGGLFRPVTTHDQARALAAVLDDRGVAATSIVGASYGGMVALAFAELFPERVARLVIVCAAHRTHPMATAVRSVQRSAVALGGDDDARGLALARALAMTTYRSAAEFEERFSPFALSAGEPGKTPARFPVEEYLEARGADFVRSFDAGRYLALSESIDLHSTRPGSLPDDALLVSFDTDVLVPPWLVDELAARQGRCPARHVTVPSPYGHDAFLKEVEQVSALVRTGLDDREVAP